MAPLPGVMHDAEYLDELYNSLRDNIPRIESFQISSPPFIDRTVFEILDVPLLCLSSLQLYVFDRQEVI